MDRKLATRHDGGLKDKALSAARLLVQRNLEPGSFIGGAVHAAPLAPESARPLALAMLRRYARVSTWTLSEVIHWAYEGFDEAHLVLGEIAVDHVERGEPVPDILKGYVVEQYHSRIARRPGPDRTKFFAQDICIALLVLWLTELLPLRATRSGRSSAKPSACSVIAQALTEAGLHRGSEDAVQRIWQNYRDLVMSERSVVGERRAMLEAGAA